MWSIILGIAIGVVLGSGVVTGLVFWGLKDMFNF